MPGATESDMPGASVPGATESSGSNLGFLVGGGCASVLLLAALAMAEGARPDTDRGGKLRQQNWRERINIHW